MDITMKASILLYTVILAFTSRGRPPLSLGSRPQVLTLLRGARVIAWRLKCHSSGEYRRIPRHFWIRRV